MAANFTAAAFDNPSVDAATNPSQHGYHHGPIPNNNHGWVPPARIANARAQVTPGDNAAAPNPGVALSTVNTRVCDIDMGGVMCGVTCVDQPSLRRHLRNNHPGAILNPGRANVSIQETVDGQNAIKLFVRSGAWRRAQYAHEPGRGPTGGLIDQYATAMEAIARDDEDFAAQFGTRFHRLFQPPGSKPEHIPSIPIASLRSERQQHSQDIEEAHTEHVLPPAPTPTHSPPTPDQPPPRRQRKKAQAYTIHIPAPDPCPAPPIPAPSHLSTRRSTRLAGEPCPVHAEHVPPSNHLSRHIPEAPKTPSSGKRKRAPPPPDDDDDVAPTPTKRPRGGKRGGRGGRGGRRGRRTAEQILLDDAQDV